MTKKFKYPFGYTQTIDQPDGSSEMTAFLFVSEEAASDNRQRDAVKVVAHGLSVDVWARVETRETLQRDFSINKFLRIKTTHIELACTHSAHALQEEVESGEVYCVTCDCFQKIVVSVEA